MIIVMLELVYDTIFSKFGNKKNVCVTLLLQRHRKQTRRDVGIDISYNVFENWEQQQKNRTTIFYVCPANTQIAIEELVHYTMKYCVPKKINTC